MHLKSFECAKEVDPTICTKQMHSAVVSGNVRGALFGTFKQDSHMASEPLYLPVNDAYMASEPLTVTIYEIT